MRLLIPSGCFVELYVGPEDAAEPPLLNERDGAILLRHPYFDEGGEPFVARAVLLMPARGRTPSLDGGAASAAAA